MHRLPLAAVLLASLAAPLAAQPGRAVPVPRGVAEDIASRARAEGADDERSDAAQVLRFTEAETRDLNGDGRPEYVVTGSGPLCGANNCTRWVYRRGASGRFHHLLETGGSRLETERAGAGGWRDLRGVSHLSAAESFHSVFRFDGADYEEVATELHTRDGAAFRVSSPLPVRGQPRRVTLDPLPAAPGAGVRLSAGYPGCASGRGTPGRLCGAPRLVLSEPAGGRALPAPGAACFTLEVEPLDGTPPHSSRVACEAAAAPGGRPGRALALRLTPEAWEAVAKAYRIRLVAEGGTVTVEDAARQALTSFVDRVWRLNGMTLYPNDG